MFKQENYEKYLSILEEELVPALGCTEPISVAYGAALANKYLDNFPTKISIKSSGNIIKNAKSVIVPNTGGLKGMQASLLAGVVGGDPELELEVLSPVTKEDIDKIHSLMNTGLVEIQQLDTPSTLHTITTLTDGEKVAEVEIRFEHTNVVRVTVDGEDIHKVEVDENSDVAHGTDRSILTVDQILDFIEVAKLEDYQDILELQIDNNIAIAEEGLENEWGMNVGASIIEYGEGTLKSKVTGYAAAGSDARMSGCTLPVVTNSGSGNNGMTCSIPVVVYAREKGYSYEQMLKALLLSNLITIHVKTGLTRLSCYCGAVTGGSGSAAGMAYLDGLSREQIKYAIINVLGNLSGIICDGAKESCASKIASSVDAAFQALNLARENKVFSHGCGIVESDVEATIRNVGELGRVGMKGTDETILEIMTNISN